MNTQPEALRAADFLDRRGAYGDKETAAELRRLHARELHYEMIDHQNKLLHALNQELLEALKVDQHDMVADKDGHMVFRKDVAIAKAEAV